MDLYKYIFDNSPKKEENYQQFVKKKKIFWIHFE